MKDYIKEANKGLLLDKYFLYRGYGYTHKDAWDKAFEYLRSVGLVRR